MSTVVVNVETQSQPFPAATVPAGITISLSGGVVAPQTVTTAPYSASFADVAPGTYTASAVATDSSGNALGSPAVSAEFTIAEPDVNIDIPSTVTVTVS